MTLRALSRLLDRAPRARRRPLRRGARAIAPVAAATIAALAACDSTTDPGGIAIPARAAITGVVALTDVGGAPSADNGGVIVSADGSSATTITDRDGRWRLDGLASGAYTLSFTKAGYGVMRAPGVRSGTALADTVRIGQIPPYAAVVDELQISTEFGDSAIVVRGHLTAPPPANATLTAVILLWSDRAEVTPSDPTSYALWSASFGNGASTDFVAVEPLAQVRAALSGTDDAYVTAYPSSAACSCYDDPVTKRRVFVSLGTGSAPSPVTLRPDTAVPPVVYPTGGTTLAGLAALDVAGDAHRDLITIARGDGSVRVLPGGPAGTFDTALTFPGGNDATRATAGDVNGDGIPDLLVVGHLANAFSVRLGAGGGRFGPPVTYPLRNHGNRFVVADLNGDGYADVVVAHDGSGVPVYVTAFLGSATGELHRVWELGTDYFTTMGIAAGDFDGDGKTDVAVAMNDNRAAVLVLRGLGTGEFAAPVVLPPMPSNPGVADGTAALAVGDVNGDGRDDIVVACFSLTNQLLVRLATGSGFADPVSIPLPSPVDVALGDLDGDRQLDIVAANIGDGTVSLLRGRGDGTFEPSVHVPVGPEPTSLAVADFDGNGRADIAVTSLGDHTVRVLLNPAFHAPADRSRAGGAPRGVVRCNELRPGRTTRPSSSGQCAPAGASSANGKLLLATLAAAGVRPTRSHDGDRHLTPTRASAPRRSRR